MLTDHRRGRTAPGTRRNFAAALAEPVPLLRDHAAWTPDQACGDYLHLSFEQAGKILFPARGGRMIEDRPDPGPSLEGGSPALHAAGGICTVYVYETDHGDRSAEELVPHPR